MTITQKQYPEDFVRRVKELFPDWPELQQYIEEGSEMVGRCLNDSSHEAAIKPEVILKMIDEGEISNLRQLAQTALDKRRLYADWGEIAESMFYGR